jgi:hypothetical protein
MKYKICCTKGDFISMEMYINIKEGNRGCKAFIGIGYDGKYE